MTEFDLPVVRGHYIPGNPRRNPRQLLVAHLKYAQHRKLGPQETREDRFIFDQASDQVQRPDAINDIMAHGSRSVRFHKIVLSPAEYEHIEDFRQWTRDIMRDLEQRKGIRLHWYAIVHNHQREQIDTPHVHVVLAGAGEDLKEQTDTLKTVHMHWLKDYGFMRRSGREHSNFSFYQQIQQELEQIEREEREAVQNNRFSSLPFLPSHDRDC